MSDLCHNCLNCHFPEPCQNNLMQCEICYAYGHHYVFCHRSVHHRDPNYTYQSLCHNCDKWHLPYPCPESEYRCSECGHYGHQEWFCPVNPHDRVERLRNERSRLPRPPAPTNHHDADGTFWAIPQNTINQIKLHAIQEAFGLLHQGWSMLNVAQHFAFADSRPMRRALNGPPPLVSGIPDAQGSTDNAFAANAFTNGGNANEHCADSVGSNAPPAYNASDAQNLRAQAYAQAHAQVHAQVHAQAEAQARAQDRAQAGVEAQEQAEALARFEAEERAQAEANSHTQANELAHAEAQAQKQGLALSQLKTEEEAQAQAPDHAQAQAQAKANNSELMQNEQASQAAHALNQIENTQSARGETVPASTPGLGIYEEMQRRFDNRELAQGIAPAVQSNGLALRVEQARKGDFTIDTEGIPGPQQPILPMQQQPAQMTPNPELPGIAESIENTPAEKATNIVSETDLGPRCVKCTRAHKRCTHREVIQKTAPENYPAQSLPSMLDKPVKPLNSSAMSTGYAADVEKPEKKKPSVKRRRAA